MLLNDDKSFEEKVELVVSNYIELLKERPDLPIFMLSEIRNHPQEMAAKLGIDKLMHEIKFFRELAQRCPDGVHPLQLFMNLLSMTVFPFIGKPVISVATGMDDETYMMMMEQRRTLIPRWFMSMLKPQE